MDDPRQQIIETCRVLFARNLSDTVGGNLSVRTGDLVYMTPRYLGSRFHWNIRPDQVLVVDPSRRVVEGEGELSRESALHFGIYDAFPQAGAIVHAHPHVDHQPHSDRHPPSGRCAGAAGVRPVGRVMIDRAPAGRARPR